ncbi:polyprenyl synthetase family protein [Aeromicrobium wangtongii]|uniref:Polyprenyl synthetase family protein n=1 Tax=Aeromicrobium wangtongii TaxID=2969247 RepID=A0ABY5MBW5_9ACTN|nr:polyprenyl synthetase family protein [Aeromicrobium wangtongii]MCD9196722.1 polyprenyl synthetase family protein [Aeromicrobium wangtongii]UUP14232.1 polyprenyl synthetase family protein [Aeromicrobium wangtongii]
MTALPDQGYRPVSRADADGSLAMVEDRLEDFVAQRCQVLLDVSPDLAPVTEMVRHLAHGGKRLRASFCLWGWRGGGGDGQDAAIDGAAALELFHLAALVHDDVMDHSATRRGSSTAHEAFAARHRDEILDGDAADFGTGAALLIGDLCLTWSDELLSHAVVDPSRRTAVRGVYDLMRSQVMAGQYLDMLEQARPGTRPHESRLVLRYKSAKYTVEHPLLLGGALSGASADVLDAYRRFGVPVGEAFQLRDDVLGVFGDPARTGKPVGDDLREGKKTLLVLAALERADVVQRRLLQRHLGDPGLTDRAVAELQDVLVDTGALADVERQITQLTEQGVEAIGAGAVPKSVATGLAELALSIAGRTA